MTQVISDPAMVQQLRQAQTTVKLVDADGTVIGHFVPEVPTPLEPHISREEIERRIKKGGGRPLKDILADLEKRA